MLKLIGQLHRNDCNQCRSLETTPYLVSMSSETTSQACPYDPFILPYVWGGLGEAKAYAEIPHPLQMLSQILSSGWYPAVLIDLLGSIHWQTPHAHSAAESEGFSETFTIVLLLFLFIHSYSFTHVSCCVVSRMSNQWWCYFAVLKDYEPCHPFALQEGDIVCYWRCWLCRFLS